MTKLLGLHLNEHLTWDDHKDLYLLPAKHFGYSQENKELLVNQQQGYPSFVRCVLPVCLWRKPYGYSLIRHLRTIGSMKHTNFISVDKTLSIFSQRREGTSAGGKFKSSRRAACISHRYINGS